MRKIFILLIIFIVFFNTCAKKEQSNLKALDLESVKTINLSDSSFSEILIHFNWLLGYNLGNARDKLEFNQDNSYSLIDFYGLGKYAIGKYEIINDNEVLLSYPIEFPRGFTDPVSNKLSRLFIENNLSLKLDREYKDLYNLGKLYSENIFFVSDLISPEDKEYEIDNAIAIKRNGFIKILNTINTRSEPSVNSTLKMVNLKDRERINPNYLINYNATISLVFPEEVYKYEAISKNIDEIDGFNKPWYRIIIPHEYNVTYAWVYGGYVEEVSSINISPDKTRELQINIIKELINRGLVYENYLEDFINMPR